MSPLTLSGATLFVITLVLCTGPLPGAHGASMTNFKVQNEEKHHGVHTGGCLVDDDCDASTCCVGGKEVYWRSYRGVVKVKKGVCEPLRQTGQMCMPSFLSSLFGATEGSKVICGCRAGLACESHGNSFRCSKPDNTKLPEDFEDIFQAEM